MPPGRPIARWRLMTPSGSVGAIAVIQLVGDVGAVLRSIAGGDVPVGAISVRNLAGVDEGVVARVTPTVAQLMPHGGAAAVRGVIAALDAAGVVEAVSGDERDEFPEAGSRLEAMMLAALSRAASPLAIDLLLDQPRRWRDAGVDPDRPEQARAASERDRVLRRLIDPPLVVALGPPNIGKSTLANALAGRAVSLVADEPGTTRDHVGVVLELSGLVVRYADAPGLKGASGDAIERQAEGLALRLARSADLVLLCGDAASPPVAVPGVGESLRVALRSDLGRPSWPADAVLSRTTGGELEGLGVLASLIAERLVPGRVLADPAPWRWWD